MSRKLVLLISVAAIAVAVLGATLVLYFSPDSTNLGKADPTSIKVGILAPLTKNLADYGVELRNGAVLAVKEINEQGRFKVDLVERDEEGDPELAKKHAEDLASDSEILGVVGPVTSSVTLAAGPIFEQKGLVLISPAATNPKISDLGNYIFRVCPSDAQQGEQLARFAYQDRGYKRALVLVDVAEGSKAYSQGLADVFSEEFKRLGGEIVADTYKSGDLDFSRQIEAIKQYGKIDVIFIPGYTAEPPLISQQLRKQQLSIPIIGGDGVGEGIMNGKLINIGGNTVEGLIATSFFDPNNPDPAAQAFVKKYQDNFGKSPSWVAVYAYDAMRVLVNAIEQADSKDRKLIRDRLASTQNFKSTGRMISFDQNGDVSSDILKLVIKGGKYEVFK